MAGIFGFGSSSPAPMTMTVTNTPAADLALTNFAYCSASDLRNFSGSGSGSALAFALVGDSLVLSLRANESIRDGHIALNAIQRRHAKVSTGDTISVSRFILPDNFKLALLTLELEFVKAKGKNEQVDAALLAQQLRKRFIDQVPDCHSRRLSKMDTETTTYDLILYDEDNHISSQLKVGQEIDPLKFIPIDPHCDSWTLTPRMQAYIKMTGLEHLAKLKKRWIDYALINALVERWRPETNTFHFIGGEKTITMEDVSYLYGLPIDGKTVTGLVWSNRDRLEDTCNRLLGVKVEKAAYGRGGQLSLAWIRKKFGQMPTRSTVDDERRYARAFLFSLVSSQLCTNNAGARGHAYILELFEDFERYAWGPACLASVYRSMTRATQTKDRLRTITGPLQLLQIWAYSHTAVGRPLRPRLDALCFEYPLFRMWHRILKIRPVSGTIPERRAELNQVSDDQIKNQPYLKWSTMLNDIVEENDRSIFRSTAPLIYYWIIERHRVPPKHPRRASLQIMILYLILR